MLREHQLSDTIATTSIDNRHIEWVVGVLEHLSLVRVRWCRASAENTRVQRVSEVYISREMYWKRCSSKALRKHLRHDCYWGNGGVTPLTMIYIVLLSIILDSKCTKYNPIIIQHDLDHFVVKRNLGIRLISKFTKPYFLCFYSRTLF